jgi:Tol biopolymer transport system component
MPVSPWGLNLANAGLAIAPDGRTVVFAAGPPNESSWRLYARRLAENEPRALKGTEGASLPFFSPDGQQVGFWKDYQLFRVRLDGGTPVPICRTQEQFGAAWGRDERIVFGGGWANPGIWVVPAAGGTPQIIVKPAGRGTTWYSHPDLLPANRGVLFSTYSGGRASVQVWSPSTGIKPLIDGAMRAQYVPPGLLVYDADRELRYVEFDAERLEIRGRPRVAVEEIRSDMSNPLWAVAASRVVAYEPSYVGLKRLVWRTRQGATTVLPFKERMYTGVVISPDGERLGVGVQDGIRRSTWGGAIDHEPLAPLTDGEDEIFLAFSPDAKWLAFTRHVEGRYNIFRVRADGSGMLEQLGNGERPQGGPEFSRDGKRFLLNVEDQSGEVHLWERSVDPPGPMRPFILTASVSIEENGRFSPDGRWVAYTSNATGASEVWVQEYPKGRRLQVSTDGGMFPRWNPRGGEIFYRGASSLTAVTFVDGRAGRPQPLPFPGGPLLFNGFDVSPDGQRFLMLDSVESVAEPSQIHVVFDWAASSTPTSPRSSGMAAPPASTRPSGGSGATVRRSSSGSIRPRALATIPTSGSRPPSPSRRTARPLRDSAV